MKSIILTFDYEMFFGDIPGTVRKSILEPTALILEELKLNNGKATFFVDYLMLKRLLTENSETKEEAKLIVCQLKDIVKSGSRIELHLHPHWLDAKYKNGLWDFSNYTHYCLDSLNVEEVVSLFVEGTDFLNSLAREVDPSYNVRGFRAGGWQILPFEKLMQGFEAAGIVFDSSVMPGVVLSSHNFVQDFSKIPSSLTYSFSNDPIVLDEDGKFVEIPITTYQHTFFSFFISYWLSYFSRKKIIPLADGSHLRKDLIQKKQKKSYMQKIYGNRTFGINNYMPFVLKLILKLYSKEVTVFMCHPKDYTSVTMRNLKHISQNYNLITYIDILTRNETENIISA